MKGRPPAKKVVNVDHSGQIDAIITSVVESLFQRLDNYAMAAHISDPEVRVLLAGHELDLPEIWDDWICPDLGGEGPCRPQP